MDDLESLIVLLAGASPATLDAMGSVFEGYVNFDPNAKAIEDEDDDEFLGDLRGKLDEHAQSVRRIAPKLAGQIFAAELETSDHVRTAIALLGNEASAVYSLSRDRALLMLYHLLGSYSAAEHYKLKVAIGPRPALRCDDGAPS